MDGQRIIRRRPKRSTAKCATCKHVIFDETWGEYTKCRLKRIRIPNPGGYTDCKDYQKDTTTGNQTTTSEK